MPQKDPEALRAYQREAARKYRARKKLEEMANGSTAERMRPKALKLVPKPPSPTEADPELGTITVDKNMTREEWDRLVLETGVEYFQQCRKLNVGHVKCEGLKTAMAMVASVAHLLPAAVIQDKKHEKLRECLSNEEYRKNAIGLAVLRSKIAGA